MKIDELSGIELDYWAVRVEWPNSRVRIDNDGSPVIVEEIRPGHWFPIADVDWSFIGTIIERDKINLSSENEGVRWLAEVFIDGFSTHRGIAETALEAIKRCIIRREYGESVDHEGL